MTVITKKNTHIINVAEVSVYGKDLIDKKKCKNSITKNLKGILAIFKL